MKQIIIITLIMLISGCGSSGNSEAHRIQEYNKALNSYYRGESEQALISLERIYRDSPEYTDNTRLYARVLFYSGQGKKAVCLWEELLESGICYIDVSIFLSRIYLSESRFEEAEALIGEALSISPEDPTLLYLLADSRSRQEELSDALILLEQAEALMERQCEIYLKKAAIYQSYGYYGEALHAVNKCESLLNEDHPLQNAVKSLKKQLNSD